MSTSGKRKSSMYMSADFAALLGVNPDDMPRGKGPEERAGPDTDNAGKKDRTPQSGEADAEDKMASLSSLSRRLSWRPVSGQGARRHPIPGISAILEFAGRQAAA